MSTDEQSDPIHSKMRDYGPALSLLLLAATALTTAIAGVQWAGKDPFELRNLPTGFEYGFAILFVLASHEFGHYFAARYHKVKTSFPYFIPFPPIPFLLNFGTLGAVIRTRSQVLSRKAMFDIGVAGPLAGFLACILVLCYGLTTLPGPEYIISIHPNYDFHLNALPSSDGLPLEFGQTILFKLLIATFADSTTQFVPPMSEIYHYPYLCVGWFGLFVTAMNLIPIGQFDGGHIMYTMFGDTQKIVAKWAFVILLVLGVPSVLDSALRAILSAFSDQPVAQLIPFSEYSWSGWFIWAMISYFFIKLEHPPVPDETPLDATRLSIGWISMLILAVSFSFVPFTVTL
ncbi:MAG TPA: site-2 protease family protein [Bacteroidota bacterium]|nr:site-2 protease family protein [Bacteroidota bacterium]